MQVSKWGNSLAVRLPGIYADVANTQDAIVQTNIADGQVSQASGFSAAFALTLKAKAGAIRAARRRFICIDSLIQGGIHSNAIGGLARHSKENAGNRPYRRVAFA